MQRKKLVLIIVGLAAALLALNFLGILRPLDISAAAPSDYDENTKVLKTTQFDWFRGSGGVAVISGWWDDPSQTDLQLLDSPSYVTSWKTTGASETIIPTATLFQSLAVFKNAHWEYYISTGGDWELEKSTPANTPITLGGVLTIPPPNPLYYLTGEVNGWLRVQFVADLWSPGLNVLDGDLINDYREGGAWVRDDATLISGRGTITNPKELSVWEIGQTIPITADIGSACSKKVGASNAESGYTLELFSAAQGMTVKTWDLPCGPGTFSEDYIVTAADFSTAGGCKNTLEIRLFNDLFQKDRTDVKTIDIVSHKPDPPTMEVSVEGGVWEEGKTIHIKVITPLTAGTLVNLVVEYQETGVQVLRRDKVAQFEFDITPSVAGILTVAASIEADCFASDTVEYTLVIKDKEPLDFYDIDVASYLWLILMVIGILLILVGIFLGGFWEILIRVIIILIGVVFIIVGFLLLGG
jgi:hypothetical protein